MNMHRRRLLAPVAAAASIFLVPGTNAAPPYNTNEESDKELFNDLTDEWVDDEDSNDDTLPLDDQQDLNAERLGLTDDDDVDENIFIDTPGQRVGLLDDDEVGLLDYHDIEIGLLDDEGPEEDDDLIDISTYDENFDDITFDAEEEEEEPTVLPPKPENDRYPELHLDASDPEELGEIAPNEDENTDDSDLTEETPWDDQQKEGEEDQDDAVANIFGETKEDQHEDPEPEPKPETTPNMLAEVGDKSKGNIDINDGLVIEDQIKVESENMLDAGKINEVPNIQLQQRPTEVIEEELETENDLITLDDYQVDSTIDEINESLEKALDSIQRTNPPPIAPIDDIPSFSNDRIGNQFFADENDRRYISPNPYTKPNEKDNGPSVGLIFLVTTLLYILYKLPKIKRYIVSGTNDYNKTLPYHAGGKMRD